MSCSIEVVDYATGNTLATPHTLSPTALNNGRLDAQYTSSLNSLAGKIVFVRVRLTGSDSTITMISNDYFHDPTVTIPKATNESDVALPLAGQVRLGQNYPNPFNPRTEIPLMVSEHMDIRLVVLDALGREVVVVREGAIEAGFYVETFDASQHPSGTYFYRLETAHETQTKKMVVIK